MPNDDTRRGPSAPRDVTVHGGAAVVAGLSGTNAAGVPTAGAGAGGPAFDRQVTGSGR